MKDLLFVLWCLVVFSFGYVIGGIDNKKSECEASLPRDQVCVKHWVPKEK